MFSRFQQWCSTQKGKCGLFRWPGCVNLPETASDLAATDDPFDVPPESRRHSLPRRMLGNFLSERNIHDEAEQKSLKRLLKEHGLYNKHQTIQQRRRLRHLLQVERQAFVEGDRDECGDHCHSLDYTQPNANQSNPGPPKCVQLQTIPTSSSSVIMPTQPKPIVGMAASSRRIRRTTSMTSFTTETVDEEEPEDAPAIPPASEGCSGSQYVLHVVQADVVSRNSQCLETSI